MTLRPAPNMSKKPFFSEKILSLLRYSRNRIAPHFVLPQSSKTFVIRSFFLRKNGFLLMFLAGIKVILSPASKLASRA